MAAAIVAGLGTFERRELRGAVPWYGTLYNHACLVISAIVATLVFDHSAAPTCKSQPVRSLLAGLAAGVTYFVANEFLSGIAIAVREGRALRRSSDPTCRHIGLALLGLVPLAWLMAFAYWMSGRWSWCCLRCRCIRPRAAYQSVVELRRMFTQTVRALASAIDARDPSTKRHSEHVAGIAVEIGQEMRVSEAELEILEWAGLFHDIGKIGIPDAILLKPGRLDKAERMEMNKHPVKGAEILANAERLRYVVPLVKFHHEWYNGSGYPDRLVGEEIPLLARILTVADSFEAMTAVRPYQTAAQDPRPGHRGAATLRRHPVRSRAWSRHSCVPGPPAGWARSHRRRRAAPQTLRGPSTQPATPAADRSARAPRRCRSHKERLSPSDHAGRAAWRRRRPAPNPSHASNASVS